MHRRGKDSKQDLILFGKRGGGGGIWVYDFRNIAREEIDFTNLKKEG
jgi:hypothetical protein